MEGIMFASKYIQIGERRRKETWKGRQVKGSTKKQRNGKTAISEGVELEDMQQTIIDASV